MVNNVGGSVFAECVKSLGYEGRLATVGYVDGVMKSEIDIEALHSKRLRLFGVSNKMRNAAQRGVTVQGFTRDFLPLFAAGKLKPVIDRVYDFKDLPEAKARMEADAHVGKTSCASSDTRHARLMSMAARHRACRARSRSLH